MINNNNKLHTGVEERSIISVSQRTIPFIWISLNGLEDTLQSVWTIPLFNEAFLICKLCKFHLLKCSCRKLCLDFIKTKFK